MPDASPNDQKVQLAELWKDKFAKQRKRGILLIVFVFVTQLSAGSLPNSTCSHKPGEKSPGPHLDALTQVMRFRNTWCKRLIFMTQKGPVPCPSSLPISSNLNSDIFPEIVQDALFQALLTQIQNLVSQLISAKDQFATQFHAF